MRAIRDALPHEDVFGFVRRARGGALEDPHRAPRDPRGGVRPASQSEIRGGVADWRLYAQILGAANEFKEGDASVGVAAADEASRRTARALLANTRPADIDAHPLHADELYQFIAPARGERAHARFAQRTLGDLKQFLLSADEASIHEILPGLSSDVIACVVKLMRNDELVAIGRKIFNPLPGSRIGARGYLGARIQPNSPTDDPDDIRWQVFDGWSYAVGDVLLGTNPVSSGAASVATIQRTLQDVLATFGVDRLMPHCVLAHIDVQAEVERRWPGSTALWFQSIAGSDSANQTFGISVDSMRRYADSRSGPFGLYFETGQGADFSNGHGHGFDMLLHEARKYGFARALAARVASARRAACARPGAAREHGGAARASEHRDASRAGDGDRGAWVHVNDVAGFIGPEVFRTREQLVRCCLEDIAMGKLHGLCIGLDVCSTLHMDVSLDDLDWCLDRILPANPAYLMALPTKIDPMLGYLTTAFQDHVRLREAFGYRVDDAIWAFFQQLGVVDANGRATDHFGNPRWIYLQYRRRKGDARSDAHILEEGAQQLEAVRARGLFIAEGHGARTWELRDSLQREVRRVYDDAKLSIWAELTREFIAAIPDALELATLSADRVDYVLHPATGEQLDGTSLAALQRLRAQQAGRIEVQIAISDGLNALAIMHDGHLAPFLEALRAALDGMRLAVAREHLVIESGRVRVGYRIGEALFAGLEGPRAILHAIGERPGSGHRTFSTYITALPGDAWGKPGSADHNRTKVVSGIAATALPPASAAREVARLLGELVATDP